MKRWGWAAIFVALLCVPIWLTRATSNHLLADTDTIAILDAIKDRHDPVSWFTGDWPLGNHFYRPISTLTFEFDVAVNGASASGVGATNAALAIFSLLALFWLVRELTDSIPYAVGAAGLFWLWILDLGSTMTFLAWLGAAISLGTACLRERSLKSSIIATLVFVYLVAEINGVTELRYRIMDWIPGRTASTMTLFCLASLAAFARWIRIAAPIKERATATSLDRPATKSSVVRNEPTGGQSLWLVLAFVLFALALGSYEQAIMAPIIVFAAMWTMSPKFKTSWRLALGFILISIAYLALRKVVIPPTVSSYQNQQIRFTASAIYAFFDFVLPAVNITRFWWYSIQSGWAIWLFAQPWLFVLKIIANVSATLKMPSWTRAMWFGWIASAVSFLPMAFLKPFDHYYFLPMAFRAIFVVGLAQFAIDLAISAATRPALLAPPRLDPAPGSLLHL